MKLHWSPKSPYVRKVMVCAHELQLLPRIELVRSVAAMLHPNTALMRDNPLSKIPTLVLDDGNTLFDSAVICEYLNDLAGGSLYPAHGPQRWAALRWHAFGNGLLDALILWRNERERDESNRSEKLIAAFDTKAQATLVQLEKEARLLTQAPFSIGHITLMCALGYLDYRFAALAWRTGAPALTAWYASLQTRPAFAATEPVDG